MIYKQNKKIGLRNKLKNLVDNLSVDLFGYEKIVGNNMVRYLEKASQNEKLPLKQMFVRITTSGSTIMVFLHHKESCLREVASTELLAFFVSENTNRFGLESRISSRIKSYMQEFSTLRNVDCNHLWFRISTNGSKLAIRAYNRVQYLEEVPIKTLVKHYK